MANMMRQLTVEEIGKLIYNNHEEQCCNCRELGETIWNPDTDKMELRGVPENFIRPARAVWEAIYGKPDENA